MRKPFVLIVDDDEVIRRLVRITLPQDDYEFLEAEDGDHALELSNGGAPALVVLDWRMPGRNGGEVLAELKSRHPHTPVIMLTAERNAAPREVSERLGADAFLTKPFSPLELLATVERLLADRTIDESA